MHAALVIRTQGPEFVDYMRAHGTLRERRKKGSWIDT